MAQYYGMFRSNYLKVKNVEEFKKFCSKFNLEFIQNDKNKNLYGFIGKDEGGIPSGHEDENGEFVEADFFNEIADQLKDGEVAIVMEIGYEKMCYLTGLASAVRSDRTVINMSLNDIYEAVEKQFKNKNVTRCEY